MEDVLAVYTRPRDPDRPLVRLDETAWEKDRNIDHAKVNWHLISQTPDARIELKHLYPAI